MFLVRIADLLKAKGPSEDTDRGVQCVDARAARFGEGEALLTVFIEGERRLKLSRLHQDRGASAVEFAIIASLLLMILFGTITFGIVFNRFQGLQAGGREGARLASLTQTTLDQVRDRVRSSVSIINGSNLQDYCTGWSAAVETGCILIQTKQDGDNDGDTTDANEVQTCDASCPSTNSSGTTAPCNSVPSQGRSIYVEVRYRLRIDIPLWASPQMTASGAGEFNCE